MKHLHSIDLYPTYQAGSAGWAEHPRARVDREERGPGLPGWAHRPLWRGMVPWVLHVYRRGGRAWPGSGG